MARNLVTAIFRNAKIVHGSLPSLTSPDSETPGTFVAEVQPGGTRGTGVDTIAAWADLLRQLVDLRRAPFDAKAAGERAAYEARATAARAALEATLAEEKAVLDARLVAEAAPIEEDAKIAACAMVGTKVDGSPL